ncbi:recombinase zinc beta ribbon domain-containing protein [Candidatus Woesebacteria bacterium]|nr:recombinase zinc beta ribbon domain-containing protein [Candidatus Woesebacteria bacterium]
MILEKTFYYGLMYARKWDMSAMGQHKPITDKFTWEKAYHRVVMKKQNYTFQDNELYPLKGYLRCEVCDHPMTTSPSQGRTKTYFYYECKQKECKNLRINTSIAHKEFSELLAGIQPSKRVLKIFNHLVFKEWDKVINFAKHEALTLEKKRQSLQAELRSIRKSKDDGTYTVDEAREEAEQIRQEIAVLDIERSEMKIQQYDAEIVKNFSEHFFGHLEALWHKLDYPKKHAFMEKVFVGGIYCTENGNIRTAKLSPSFELIQSMSEKKNKNVTPSGFEPEFPG